MMRQNRSGHKKILAGLLAAAMFFTGISGVQAQAEPCDRQLAEIPATYRDAVYPDMGLEAYEAETTAFSAGSAVKGAAGAYRLSDSEWAASGGDYYFSLLGTAEKKLYLALKTEADRYMTGIGNFASSPVNRNGKTVTVYLLPHVSYRGLAAAQMKRVVSCFLFENPQYYFMRNAIVFSDTAKTVSIGLYKTFANGRIRQGYTKKFAARLEAWDDQIAAVHTAVEKERLIHELICDDVTYNENMQEDPDDTQMTQSCVSAVLFDHSTVCAGYAQLFTLLCTRAGITCVTVTSSNHAWNKVRLGSIWYNVDCTWDDWNAGYVTEYLNVTDAQLAARDTAGEHTMSPEWRGLAPSCTVTFDGAQAGGEDLAANVFAPEKMGGITALSKKSGQISVSFQPAEGCDGYVFQYGADNAMKRSKRKVLAGTACKITGLTTGKTYYVRVRSYTLDSFGNKIYGAYSNTLAVTVK